MDDDEVNFEGELSSILPQKNQEQTQLKMFKNHIPLERIWESPKTNDLSKIQK